MYLGSDAANFAVLLARVWVAIMIFAHGWRHVKAIQSGPGMANWFESLGLKPGRSTRGRSPSPRSRSRSCSCSGSSRRSLRRRVRADVRGAAHQPPQERLLPEQRQGGLRVRRHRRGALDHAGHARAGQVVARPRLRPHLPVRPEEGAARHRDRRHRWRRRVPRSRSGGRPRRTSPPPEPRQRGGRGRRTWVGSRSTTCRSGSTTSPPSTT